MAQDTLRLIDEANRSARMLTDQLVEALVQASYDGMNEKNRVLITEAIKYAYLLRSIIDIYCADNQKTGDEDGQ